MCDAESHPAQRFAAPNAIRQGVPLKELLDRSLVDLIGQSLAAVVPGFDNRRFVARAVRDLDQLELKGRALEIADAMLRRCSSSPSAHHWRKQNAMGSRRFSISLILS
jgi:hypothetical protein